MYKYAIGLTAFVVIAGASPIVHAQSYQNSGQDRYAFCQQNAQRISSYYGETPERYREGNAFRKAAKQANAVNAIAWAAGANKKKRKKLRKKAALNGFLKGAIQRGIQEDRQRKSRERYDNELRICMNAR